MSYLFEANSFIPAAKLETRFEAIEQQTGTGQSGDTQYQPLAAELYYFQTDHLGTPLEVADSDGNLVWVGQYRAWGQLKRAKDGNGERTSTDNPLRFQGQYHDEETGLHYNRFRYYDPAVGRFTTQDPIGLMGGENLYQYAPNPTGWVDPLGLNRFTSSTFNAPSGNKHTVYQQDIDWDLPINTRSGTKTNLDLASEGKSPFVVKNGSYSRLNLHYSKQNGKGSIFELSSETHQKSYGMNALHPYLPNQHPINPVNRDEFGNDRDAYWRNRAESEKNSRCKCGG